MADLKFRPLQNRVVVKPIEDQQVSAGGFHIGAMETKEKRGEILAKGKLANEVEVGETAVYGHYNPIEISLSGQKLIIMKETDIYGIIE